ncbi:MAG: hypothetical protein M1383_03170 [Patescibacteria group bacterium]|nr:hypothetical protein [Patescibacteria group bacterium]
MIYLIIALAIAARFIPHMPNFAPVTALAIFSAVYLPKKQAVAIPLAARLVSDIFLGFFQWPLMVAVYASHLIGVLFGLWIKRTKNYRWIKIVGSSLGASIIFFAVTNFAFFYPYYSHNIAGIIHSYINALPFLRGTVLGDLSYTTALFGSYELARYLLRQKAKNLLPQNSA